MKHLFTIIIILFSFSLLGQSLTHVSGQKALEGSIGGTKYSHFKRYTLGMDLFTSNTNFWEFELNYDKGLISRSEYTDYGLSARFGYIYYRVNEKTFFSGVGGLQLGYQDLYNDVQESTSGAFVYGVVLGPEIEYYPISRLGLYTRFTQQMMFGGVVKPDDKLNYFQWNYSLGVKFIIN